MEIGIFSLAIHAYRPEHSNSPKLYRSICFRSVERVESFRAISVTFLGIFPTVEARHAKRGTIIEAGFFAIIESIRVGFAVILFAIDSRRS